MGYNVLVHRVLLDKLTEARKHLKGQGLASNGTLDEEVLDLRFAIEDILEFLEGLYIKEPE